MTWQTKAFKFQNKKGRAYVANEFDLDSLMRRALSISHANRDLPSLALSASEQRTKRGGVVVVVSRRTWPDTDSPS